LKTENFSLSLSLKNSKKPKTWFGTRWSATWVGHAESGILGFLGKEREGSPEVAGLASDFIKNFAKKLVGHY
jgi:hypothetical protein